MKGIRAKILLATLPWLGAFCLFIFFVGPLEIKRVLSETATAKAINISQTAADNINVPLFFRDESSLKEAVQRIWESNDIAYVVVQDAAGKVVQSSGQGTADWARYKENTENLFTPDEKIYRTATPIRNREDVIGRLFLGFKMDFISSEAAKARTNIIILCLVFFLLGTIVVFLMSGWIARPLQTITSIARQIAGGDLSRRVEIRSRDEAGELARSFNKMVDRLQELYQSLESQVEKRTGELQREVEERKKAEDLVRENEKLLRSMVEGLGEGVGIIDQDEIFLATNPAAEEIFGVAPGGLIGRNTKDFLSPKSAAIVAEQTRNRRKGSKGVYDLEIIAATGERKMLLITAMPRFNRDGTFESALTVFTDITQRKHIENQIRETNEKLRLSVQKMERRNAELGLLSEMGETLQSCHTENEIYTLGARFGEKLFPQQSGAILLTDPPSDLLDLKSSWGETPPAAIVLDTADCWSLRRGKTHIVENPGKDIACRHIVKAGLSGFRSICVPLTSYGDLRGVLTISYAPSGRKDNSKDEETGEDLRPRLASNLAEFIGTAIVNLRLRETLREKSIRDPLTGLFNRRFMEETLDREIRRASRLKVSIGMIMVDIDHFKTFNDTYGHEAGDTMLREVGRLLMNHIRREDVVCRYGGEEFLLILPGADNELIRTRAERLRSGAQSMTIAYQQRLLGPVTLSMGCGSYPADGPDGNAVINAADLRMLQAKQEGRNRIIY